MSEKPITDAELKEWKDATEKWITGLTIDTEQYCPICGIKPVMMRRLIAEVERLREELAIMAILRHVWDMYCVEEYSKQDFDSNVRWVMLNMFHYQEDPAKIMADIAEREPSDDN